jgi:hypothetical protein
MLLQEKKLEIRNVSDMIKPLVYWCFRVSYFFVVLFFSVSFCLASETQNIQPPLFIAHAGGAIGHYTYTNSLEALNSNYEKGFRFFEIDLSWTSDGDLSPYMTGMLLIKENFLPLIRLGFQRKQNSSS